MTVSRLRRQVIIGWLLVGAFALVAALADRAAHVRVFQVAWLVGFAGYGLVVHAVRFLPLADVPGRWRTWLIGFVALRVVLLPATPSDDLYRYMWEGKIQRLGFNPYTTRPIDDAVRHLRDSDSNFEHINHPDYPAIYPPVAQLLFRGLGVFGESVYIAKVFFALLDVGVVVLLGVLLSSLKISRYRASVYALCPLVLTAFAIEGHLDSLMLLLLVAALLVCEKGRWRVGGACLGLAISSKLVCVVLWPWLLVRRPLAAVIAAGVVAATYLPFADAAWSVFDSLRRFGRGTGELGALIDILEERLGFEPEHARWLAGGALILFAGYLVARRFRWPVYATRMLAGLVLVLPVVHFWYLTWMIAFAWARLRVSWLVLALSMGLYFEAQHIQLTEGAWRMPSWVPAAVYGPFVVAWIVERWWRTRSAPPHHTDAS